MEDLVIQGEGSQSKGSVGLILVCVLALGALAVGILAYLRPKTEDTRSLFDRSIVTGGIFISNNAGVSGYANYMTTATFRQPTYPARGGVKNKTMKPHPSLTTEKWPFNPSTNGMIVLAMSLQDVATAGANYIEVSVVTKYTSYEQTLESVDGTDTIALWATSSDDPTSINEFEHMKTWQVRISSNNSMELVSSRERIALSSIKANKKYLLLTSGSSLLNPTNSRLQTSNTYANVNVYAFSYSLVVDPLLV